MKTYVKINGNEYEALIIEIGSDTSWNRRDTRTVKMISTYEKMDELFVDGLTWEIIARETVSKPDRNEDGSIKIGEDGKPIFIETVKETVTDSSEFDIRGDLTVHIDGYCSVKMGKKTDLEKANEMVEEMKEIINNNEQEFIDAIVSEVSAK